VRLLLLFLLAAAALSAETVKQGSALRVHAPAAAVSARLKEKTIRLFPDAAGGAFGLMPIAIDEKPGAYTLDFLDRSGATVETRPVQVIDAHYRKQNVTMSEGTAELKPSPGEVETTAAFRNTVSDTRYWEEPLEVPVRGCMTSPFGVQRYLNGKPTGSAHAGLDQRSPAGAPIHAAAAGTVKFVREWNLHGRTVAIDHGQGLESIYLHMSKTAATEGAQVKKGDIIGYVGTTGRSTAPHLHWTIYANGLPVNPLDWVKVAPCGSPAPATKKR
jgi:murein DD-endopeptidase MepM/ murein hydrolase activator NlpD